MTQQHLPPTDQADVEALARRAEQLLDRRAMIASAGRKLALPLLVTYVCSRDAMGMTGSGGAGATGTRTVTHTFSRSRSSRRARD